VSLQSLREVNQGFSKAMKAVKQGKEVVLTERGKPIAMIKFLDNKQEQDTIIDNSTRNDSCARPESYLRPRFGLPIVVVTGRGQ
jgi:antitoxin (DNA-binding transcriptional repressor) of toxin-antitoxin stability system